MPVDDQGPVKLAFNSSILEAHVNCKQKKVRQADFFGMARKPLFTSCLVN
jgi:hypothetical protein